MTNRPMGEIVRHQKPVTLPPSASLQEACRRMHEARIGAILVIEAGGRLVGIFTGRDAVRGVAEGRGGDVPLAEAMTRDPDTMRPGQTAIEALRLMRDGGFRHVPVVVEGRIAGIVSIGDFRPEEQARLDEETGYWEIL
jgi:CBS domain-containing protein